MTNEDDPSTKKDLTAFRDVVDEEMKKTGREYVIVGRSNHARAYEKGRAEKNDAFMVAMGNVARRVFSDEGAEVNATDADKDEVEVEADADADAGEKKKEEKEKNPTPTDKANPSNMEDSPGVPVGRNIDE